MSGLPGSVAGWWPSQFNTSRQSEFWIPCTLSVRDGPPWVHEAMTMQESAEVEPGSVLTVFQKGYALNGRLLRPARVVVAAAVGDSAD